MWNGIAWKQGMVLHPQHFQLQEDWLKQQWKLWSSMLLGKTKGIMRMDVNTQLLAVGQVQCVCLEGSWDGMVFTLGQQDVPVPCDCSQMGEGEIGALYLHKQMDSFVERRQADEFFPEYSAKILCRQQEYYLQMHTLQDCPAKEDALHLGMVYREQGNWVLNANTEDLLHFAAHPYNRYWANVLASALDKYCQDNRAAVHWDFLAGECSFWKEILYANTVQCSVAQDHLLLLSYMLNSKAETSLEKQVLGLVQYLQGNQKQVLAKIVLQKDVGGDWFGDCTAIATIEKQHMGDVLMCVEYSGPVPHLCPDLRIGSKCDLPFIVGHRLEGIGYGVQNEKDSLLVHLVQNGRYWERVLSEKTIALTGAQKAKAVTLIVYKAQLEAVAPRGVPSR
jgi:hypothetical protein